MILCLCDIPDTLSQLIRTAFIAKPGYKFYVADFSAIEARVIAHLAGESWRAEVFKNGGDIYCASASQMFHVPVEKHGINGHLRQKGKIAELALGYGGSVGALKAMGALEMGLTEDELQPLVDAWRQSNPNIVALWWDFDTAIKNAIKMHCSTASHGIKFTWRSGMLFITLPSGRKLTYIKPHIGENKFGGESVTYEGIGATKKWERLESYGPKFVENVVQAISRDLLMNAMKTLSHIITIKVETDNTSICHLHFHIRAFAFIASSSFNCFFTYFLSKFLVTKEIHPLATFMLFQLVLLPGQVPTPSAHFKHQLAPPFFP